MIVQMVDPGGIANWSVTHVDWSERKWHPKSYKARDVSDDLVRNITVRSCFLVFIVNIPFLCFYFEIFPSI